MSWVAVAVGAGSLIAGVVGSKNAKKASDAQAASADKASQVQWDMYKQTRTDMEPWRQAGITGLNEYLPLLGLPTNSTQLSSTDPAAAYLQANPDVAANSYFAANPMEHYNRYGRAEGRTWGMPTTAQGATNTTVNQQAAFDKFRSTPGYQFGLDEGQKTLQSSAAAAGGLFSGKAGKALVKFGTDYADQQGFEPYANRLAGLAGLGQTATNTIGGYGQNTAGNVGNNLLSAGNARASGLINGANAISGAVSNATGLAGLLYGNKKGFF